MYSRDILYDAEELQSFYLTLDVPRLSYGEFIRYHVVPHLQEMTKEQALAAIQTIFNEYPANKEDELLETVLRECKLVMTEDGTFQKISDLFDPGVPELVCFKDQSSRIKFPHHTLQKDYYLPIMRELGLNTHLTL